MTAPHARRLTLAVAVAGLLLLGACGGSPGESSPTTGAPARVEATTPSTAATRPTTNPTGPATTAPSPTTGTTPAAPSPLPDVAVLDAGTGETVQLAALLPAERPLLVWFWAPH